MSTPGNLHITDVNHGGYVAVAAGLCSVWMLMFYLTRVYVRVFYTPWGLDDWVLTGGTVLALIQVANVYGAVHNGFGLTERMLSSSEKQSIMKFIYISQIFYIATVCTSKVSTALLISRLTRTDTHLHAVRAIIIFTILWSVGAILLIAVRKDLSEPWLDWINGTNSLYARWISIETVGMAIEIGLVALAATLVEFLSMNSKLKYVVIGAFSVRLLVIPPTIARLVYLKPARVVVDPTFQHVLPVVLGQVCMHISLITASIPCLKPFLAPFDAAYEDEGCGNNPAASGQTLIEAASTRTISVTSVPGFMFRKVPSNLQSKRRTSSITYYTTEKHHRLSHVMSRPGQRNRRKKGEELDTTSQASPREQEEWMAALTTPGVGRPLMMRPDTLGFEVTIDSGSPNGQSPLSPAETRVGNMTVIGDEEEDDMYIRKVSEVVVEYSHGSSV